ncbi:MAG: hypothetical protein SWH78_07720 [Thermodesulfobacteriota bacterium]|nr:hypothetical protein [Thermodesulfobacteriota bacterium]
MIQPPVMVVPGITASNLDDFYPIPPEAVWSTVLKKKYDRIALHPDDVPYEAREPVRVRAVSIFEPNKRAHSLQFAAGSSISL